MIPAQGYNNRDKQSTKAILWLNWIQHSQNRQIQHAGNGREAKVGPFKVDGLDQDGTIYEFHGCFWHGHTCIRERQSWTPDHQMMEQAFLETQSKDEYLSQQGTLVTMWECTFDKM